MDCLNDKITFQIEQHEGFSVAQDGTITISEVSLDEITGIIIRTTHPYHRKEIQDKLQVSIDQEEGRE